MLVHEEPSEYGPWLWLVLIIPVGMLIGAAVAAYYGEFEAASVLFGESLFVGLLFYFIMPRRLQIYEEELRIVLGSPFRISIPFSTIKEVKHSAGVKAYFFSGIRFATSSQYVVEIVRSRGMNYVISPQNGDLFLNQLNQAVRASKTAR